MTTANSHAHMAKPFKWNERTWPSLAAFCREYGLHDTTVRNRLERGITDARLVDRGRLMHGKKT